jgi:hypothetical protein
MTITLDFICGVSCGIEFITDEEEGFSYFVMDLLILRLMFIGEIKK